MAAREAEAEALRDGIMRVAFQVPAAPPRQPPRQLHTTNRHPPPRPPRSPPQQWDAQPAPSEADREAMLRHRRTSSSKPVDWARFDTIIADGCFSPLGTPTRERFFSERSSQRASLAPSASPSTPWPGNANSPTAATAGAGPSVEPPSMAITSAIQHPALRLTQRRPSATIQVVHATEASQDDDDDGPLGSATTVGTSILDLDQYDFTTPPPAAASGETLGDRAWHRRRLSTRFPPATASSAAAAKRRSSIAGDYDGVRIGRVDGDGDSPTLPTFHGGVAPEPLKVVKAGGGGASSMTPAAAAAAGEGVGEEDESPVLPVWQEYHTIRAEKKTK